MSRSKFSSSVGLFGLLLMLTGCGQEPEPPVTRSPLGAVPAEAQRPGDPAAGYRALLNNAYVTCGIPYTAYKKMAPTPTPDQWLPDRQGRNAELPYNLTAHTSARGVELVTSNCLGCHAGYFDDQLVIGLGNESLDFTRDPVVAAEGAGAYVTGGAEALEWRKWADRIAAIAPYMITDTVGVNPANNLTLALLAHRDPKTLAWSAEPLLAPPPTQPLPVSVPPWWRVQKKHAMFYNAEGRGDHARFMMLISTVCTDDLAEARAIDAYFTDIRAYLATLGPPAYPFPVDATLAEQGHGVFNQTCARCHGTYGQEWTYPNLVIGVAEVGTDPALAIAASRNADRFIRWYNTSFYGEISRVAPAPGYIAPPLDGVWATAPYLHNGSVPTIATLLDSPKRPRYWTRSFDARDYDAQALGWHYTALPHGKEGARDATQRKRIYDTTLPGYANTGHTFGDGLTAAQRKAVLEYLKTL
jgi:mono/diheme cytochrome c family protein